MDCRKRRQNSQIEQSVWLKEKLHVCFHFCLENGLEVSSHRIDTSFFIKKRFL